MRPDLFLSGAVRYGVEGKDSKLLFEILQANRLSPKALKRSPKNGKIRFLLTYKQAQAFERAVANSFSFTREETGVRALGRRLLRSPGLLSGILLSLLLFLGARLLVWDVRIMGTEKIGREELEDTLAELGIFRGAFLPALDADALALSLRQADTRVGYAAINVKGSVVYVQVRENEPVPSQSAKKPANLVAAYDGVVTMPLIFEGECLVEAGEIVRAGQILAGGLVDTQNYGYRVTRAAGQVLARTVHTYTVRVPFAYEEKVYTGEKKSEISLLFFQRAQKVFKNIGQIRDKCDIIEEIKWFRTPAGAQLPFGYCLRTRVAYETERRTYTLQDARRVAQDELQRQLSADSTGRTLLEKSVEWSVDGEGVTLFCTVVCEEDIARTQEFVMQP